MPRKIPVADQLRVAKLLLEETSAGLPMFSHVQISLNVGVSRRSVAEIQRRLMKRAWALVRLQSLEKTILQELFHD